MKEPIISVSGLRGIVGESLTAESAARYVRAFVALAPPGSIVVTRDGRANGPLIAEAVKAAILAAGRNCLDAGVAATPTTGVLVRHLAAAGGIQISASHNPAEYNGMKLFGPDGRILTAALGGRVRDRYYADVATPVASDKPGRVSDVVAAADPHWELIREIVDVEAIRARKFKVLLDANHGSGSLLGRVLLEGLGCSVEILGETADGAFDHLPEPTAENLAGVLKRVVESRADVGFCQDPDADRLAIIDERGRYLGEEYTLAICVDHVLRHELGTVVTNCSTSRMAQDVAAKHKVPFFRSAVGEANVVELMEAHEAVIGGEGNGGVIDPRVGLVRDSFVGMALVLDAMAERGLPVSALADELPRYEIVKTKVELAADRLPTALAAIEKHFAGAVSDRLDGLRLDFDNAWLLVRGSNTEPIVRIFAEAPTAKEAQRLCDEAAQAIR